jgi:AraC-like DNA-binding protein
LLEVVSENRGEDAVFALGSNVPAVCENNPLFELLLGAESPDELVARWVAIEPFAHPTYRTRLVERGNGELLFEHFARKGSPPSRLDDLFVAGLMVGLLDRFGCVGLEARIGSERSPRAYSSGKSQRGAAETPVSHRWLVRWANVADRKPASPRSDAPRTRGHGGGNGIVARLTELIAGKPAADWRVDEAAHILGVSRRTLQRRLADANVNFSELVQRTRVRCAHGLLERTSWDLTTVAASCGFADHAHLTRTFRRHWDIPPSGLRKALQSRTVFGVEDPVSSLFK